MFGPLSPSDWLSLVIASVALGWNVYRDVILKAKVRVYFGVFRALAAGQRLADGHRYLKISATNHGPGPVTIVMIAGHAAPLWRRLLRRPESFVILNDHTNPLNRRLPHKLEIGDTLDLFLPYNDRCVLAGTATRIGVTDSFGRVLLAPAKNLAEAREQFRKDFPDAKLRDRP